MSVHGDVITYQLTPEELEKYRGPNWKPSEVKPKKTGAFYPKEMQPKEKKKPKYTHALLAKPIKKCSCGKKAEKREMCTSCYNKWYSAMKGKRKGPKQKAEKKCEKRGRKKINISCTVVENGETCGDKAHRRQMCQKHYRLWSRHGDPLYAWKGEVEIKPYIRNGKLIDGFVRKVGK